MRWLWLPGCGGGDVPWWKRIARGPWPALGVLVLGPLFLIMLAVLAGPFVVALVLFTPVASMLIVLATTLGVCVAAGYVRHVRAGLACMRVRGLCGSCGYEIGDIDAADDGLTVCPECGACWDLRVAEAPRVVVVADCAAGRQGPAPLP